VLFHPEANHRSAFWTQWVNRWIIHAYGSVFGFSLVLSLFLPLSVSLSLSLFVGDLVECGLLVDWNRQLSCFSDASHPAIMGRGEEKGSGFFGRWWGGLIGEAKTGGGKSASR
jgi:hypothetical protein